MGRNCINGRQTIGRVWIFSSPPRYATFQGRLQMWSFQGAPPGRERTKASGRAGAQVGGEVPEPWSERGRGTGEKWEGKP